MGRGPRAKRVEAGVVRGGLLAKSCVGAPRPLFFALKPHAFDALRYPERAAGQPPTPVVCRSRRPRQSLPDDRTGPRLLVPGGGRPRQLADGSSPAAVLRRRTSVLVSDPFGLILIVQLCGSALVNLVNAWGTGDDALRRPADHPVVGLCRQGRPAPAHRCAGHPLRAGRLRRYHLHQYLER